MILEMKIKAPKQLNDLITEWRDDYFHDIIVDGKCVPADINKRNELEKRLLRVFSQLHMMELGYLSIQHATYEEGSYVVTLCNKKVEA